ncbi:PEP/pyruvate-binding domain-containing protein [Desulforhopalus singaporensis]|uniref:Phosphoenolpyruvate synthase n=1 Tax=Desulforhopalus singaporensis TaxID=91360 RepID=A0A1H0KHJ9_9BACT|nr:PEP/pyruvate-binding domain-containing protein [Desulforhopalus singaporensis]SDO55241.1 pyruvate, water dikinase [Desulforhopalus singaporensis]
MKTLLARLKRLFSSPAAAHPTLEELQHLFTSRYLHFRELLTANNNALEAMAEMEKALLDGRSYSMAFIRAKSTIITVNVFKMIDNLRYIADGRYGQLVVAYRNIEKTIDELIDQSRPAVEGDWVLPLTRVNRSLVELSGEKMANLGEAGTVKDIQIPEGFVITSGAAQAVFSHNNLFTEINRIIQQTDARDLEDLHRRSHQVQKLIMACSLPTELERLIKEQFDLLENKIGRPIEVAVRSSGLGEDLGRASFAGLYRTELHIDRDQLIDAYKAVLASTYSARAMTYRLTKGYRHEQMLMGVGCLLMVEAAVSGVCYSRSMTGERQCMEIFWAPGSGKGVVEGTKDTGRLLVKRHYPFEIIEKKGTPLSVLSDKQVTQISEAAMKLEARFGTEQDIEWSIDSSGSLFILQSRPISVSPWAQSQPDPAPLADQQLLLRGGVTACPGAEAGQVWVVRSTVDLLGFPHGAVLVVEHPLPEWAPLLRRASALIATTGSVAGHLATIAREFNCPALLGVRDALNVLQNGQVVTVDATSRFIYGDRVDQVISCNVDKQNPMHNSPVEQTLKAVLSRITPLTLTDPTSPFFRSSRCRTLHDITRFCHEKAVVDMFGFGERYRYVKGAAKRLVGNMPMEWWVINLADGFAATYDASNKYILIDEITCEPMLAIWQGMHAIPWAGPPRVNVRGMGAILFQSTRNPGLDPAAPSAMVQKNYFLISKNYCNLSFRLGYHYATIEAYISSLRTERYVTFRFKGGAADESRRIARVELLAELLVRHQFRVEKIGDSLAARVEKRSQNVLYNCLKILGYLSIHTRQIDMVMSAPGQMMRYRNKFNKEIKEMLSHGKREN